MQVNIYEAKNNFSKLVDMAAGGEEIIVAKNGMPKAKLVPFSEGEKKGPRRGGQWKGEVWMAPDFDAFTAELAEMFGTGSK